MKKELEIVNLRELSFNEMTFINGGGPGFKWLGEVLGVVATVLDPIYNFPLYVSVEIAEIETDVRQMIEVLNHR
jgi:hypothetical protein